MRTTEASKQLLEKKNRILILENEGYGKEPGINKCGNCNCAGHTRIKCDNPCRTCDELVYCRHLQFTEKTWVPKCSQLVTLEEQLLSINISQ